MGLTVLLGGARSGKSTMATSMAAAADTTVCYIATAEARDAEMSSRIETHRRERPSTWTTIKEPVDLSAALTKVLDDDVAIIDCLTLWVSNLIEQGMTDDEVVHKADEAARIAAARAALTIAVTNEVGSGIVPVNELARRYRDLLGMVNARWCAYSKDSFLVVAGRALRLSDPSTIARS